MTNDLPPTDRDFQIYEAVHVAGTSTYAQAATHHISQTRVRQIVRRVVQWLAQTLPPQADIAKEQETHLARQIAADRFRYQLEETTELWTKTRETKYANLRIRLTTAQARLGVVGTLLDGLIADALEATHETDAPTDPRRVHEQREMHLSPATTVELPPDLAHFEQLILQAEQLAAQTVPDKVVLSRREGQAAEYAPHSPALQPTLTASSKDFTSDIASRPIRVPHSPLPASSPPPSEDCSLEAKSSPDASQPSSSEVSSTSTTPTTYDNFPVPNPTPQSDAIAPARPLLTTPNPLPITQLHLTPNHPGTSLTPPTSYSSLSAPAAAPYHEHSLSSPPTQTIGT